MAKEPIREPGAEWLATPQTADASAVKVRQGSEATRRSSAKPWRPVTMTSIRALAQRITDRFQPDKIIIFGSYAYGNPKPESDVDLLVIMDTPLRSREQRLEISRALSPRPLPLDIIVRTPQELAERIALGDLFLREITTRGKVLYERHRD